MKEYMTVKCQNQREGRTCGNILCKRIDNLIILKRHGRIVEMFTTKEHPVTIICERCGGKTKIEGTENETS